MSAYLYRIVIDSYEGDAGFPAVTHQFTGETEAQAEGYLAAHLNSDRFFRGCAEGHVDVPRGGFACSNRVRWRGWVRRPAGRRRPAPFLPPRDPFPFRS